MNTMWLQYYQPLVTDLVQKALVQLCNEHVPHEGKLEIDGLVCISNGNLDKQIVVKVHEVIGNQDQGASSGKTKGHILQVPGYKRRVEGQEMTELPKKLQKTEIQLSPRSIPLNLSQNHARDGSASPNSSSTVAIPGKESPSTGKDPKRMSISLLKLLSSDQPSESLNFTRATEPPSPPQRKSLFQKVESPSSSRECSPVSDAMLAKETKCKICSKVVKNVHQLVSHTADVHKRYLCKHCLNSFSLRCNLHRHERLHSGIKPFPCSRCGKSFARNADLKLHIQKHENSTDDEPANTTCQRCSKVFVNVHSLRYHLFKVHRVQDGIYACTICEKVYDDEDTYNKHWESHTDSLVQHGQIKVTIRPPKPMDDDDMETMEEDLEQTTLESKSDAEETHMEHEVPNRKVSPGKSHKTVTYKSLLQPKFKPLVFPKEEPSSDCPDKDQDEDTDQRSNTGEDTSSARMETSNSLSDSNYVESSTDTPRDVAPQANMGIDFEAIKKEFGPLFRYSEMASNGGDSDAQSEDLSLCASLNIPTAGDSRGTSPALSDIQNSVSGTGKHKRKSRPFRHVTDAMRLESEDFENADSPDCPVSADHDFSHIPSTIVSSSKTLMAGATLIQVNTEREKKCAVSREQSPANSLDGKRSISSSHGKTNSGSPTVTPKAKLKSGLDSEPQGSPSAEVLADDEVTYECRYGGCGQKFFGFKAYEDHFFCAHGRFPCKLCEQSFTCKNNRTRHIRNHLGIAKRHSCDRCSKTFTRPDTLQEHKFIHTQSYKADHCNGCGATFDRKALLLAHMKKCFRSKPELLEKDMLDSIPSNSN